MKCYQCGNNSMFLVGPEGQQVPLCLNCHLKYVQLLDKQNEMLERVVNYQTANMETIAGVPAFLPRYPERKVIKTGDITLNNIKIDNSTIGVLNTGNIETIDMAVTSLRQTGNEEISKGITELSEAIIRNNEINDETKNQVIEILSVIATEATAPTEKRRKSIIKPLINELSTLISGISSLSQLWRNIQPIIESL